MKPLILFLLLLLLVVPAFPQGYSQSLVSKTTLLPGTTYFYPSGAASSAGSWITFDAAKGNYDMALFLRTDSTTGTNLPCSLRVEPILGASADDTTGYIGYANYRFWYAKFDSVVTSTLQHPAESRVFFHDSFGTILARDTCFVVSASLPPHWKHRWRVTVSDTISVTLTEVGRR